MSSRIQDPAAVHALAWLAFANTVGVLLSLLLLRPELGDLLGALTYGRWMPVHTNAQLYGWCSFPLIGALHRWYRGPRQPGDGFRLALAGWSAALALGCVSWLSGYQSGKLFLEWHAWAHPLLPLAMLGLWLTLVRETWIRRGDAGPGRLARAAGLVLLAPVPLAIWWASARTAFPPVNPHSGGATGTSLLGSTLAIVALFALLPHLLGVGLHPARAGGARRQGRLFWSAWGLSLVLTAAMGHGDVSHHRVSQIAGLATLALWVPLGIRQARLYAWRAATVRWLAAAAVWWLLLVSTGWITFLPGVSERLKFTHALVAHAHLAMAGFVSSMLLAVLQESGPRLFRGFWAWQLATVLHIGALAVLGVLETGTGDLFRAEPWTDRLLALRLAAGAVMAFTSLWWCADHAGRLRAAERSATVPPSVCPTP
jgi:cytochrome c oxidase cbb3-type subunit 1